MAAGDTEVTPTVVPRTTRAILNGANHRVGHFRCPACWPYAAVLCTLTSGCLGRIHCVWGQEVRDLLYGQCDTCGVLVKEGDDVP